MPNAIVRIVSHRAVASRLTTVVPNMSITVGIDVGPAFKVIFKTKLKSAVVVWSDKTVIARTIPCGPTSARHVEVTDACHDFLQLVLQGRGFIDADVVGYGRVAFLRDGHVVVALAEPIPSIVAAFVQDDVSHWVSLLLVPVLVDEADHSALGSVATVQRHGNIHAVEQHILGDVVGPGDS